MATREVRAVLVLLFVLVVFPRAMTAQNQPVPNSDLDALMSKVLAKREIDWDRLHNYVFREKEVLELRGLGSAPIESWRREYVWLVRDGYLVRSPVKANGVSLSKEEQAKAEREWTEDRKNQKRNSLEREAFFGFKFQPGRYLLAGKKKHEGRDVLVVEYYPKLRDLDDDEEGHKGERPKEKSDNADKKKSSKRDKDEDLGDYYERMFEKTLLVTMLVLPEENQLVQMTFDNVGLDFLPGRWLVRIDDLKADMTMHKPFENIWLPGAIHAFGSVTTANGSLTVRYAREFFDYQKTDVKVRFWYEKPAAPQEKKP
ncbi:MAG: hypothetical protein EHM61_21715 [Acidobacteria bacterium]|nr:MAG: hypothetical protein EHM61_21715 [Acidobacteriota bacterium]